jgi:hypothetical protein
MLVGRTPRLQFLPMLPDQFESELSIRGIILLATWREGFAELRQHPRIDGVKDQVLILQERIDQAAFRWLQADGNVATRQSRRQLSSPVVNRFRHRPHHAVFFLFSTGRPSTKIVFRICPVDAHQGGIACVMSHIVVLLVHKLLATGTCELYFCEGLIVKSSVRQHLSIRWRNTAHPTARNALLSRPDDPMWSFVAAGCMSLAYPLPL